MSLVFHYHPLSSYCWKVLAALYENETPFEPHIVDLGDEASRAAHLALWPLGKMPVLHDRARGEVVPESSAILDYLDLRFPGPLRITPADPDRAWRARLWDRIFDLHVHHHVQRIVADRLRPPGAKDPAGVAEAQERLAVAYAYVEKEAQGRTWFTGDDFGLADLAAAPALYYADKVRPLGAGERAIRAYLDRLLARPAFARVLKEAEPYFAMFPTG